MADNNYNTQNNTNPGFVTGNNTVQGQQSGMAVSTNGFDIGKWLQDVVQKLNTPNNNNSSQGGMAIHPVQQAAIDAAVSKTKKLTNDAIDMAGKHGVDVAKHIVDINSNFGGQQPQPLDVNSLNTNSIPTPNNSSQSIDAQSQINNNILNRLLQASKGTTFLQRFSDNLAKMEGGVTQSDQLNNLANIQRLAAGQPAEIAVPLAQAAELNQRIAGAEPIQPKDIAELNRQTYSATIQAANDAWERNTNEIKTMQEQYKSLQEGRSGWSKGVGGQTKQMKDLQQTIIAKMKQNQQHLSNMQTLFKNPPNAVSENPSKVNNSPFQVGQQYNGETIKNVRRIK